MKRRQRLASHRDVGFEPETHIRHFVRYPPLSVLIQREPAPFVGLSNRGSEDAIDIGIAEGCAVGTLRWNLCGVERASQDVRISKRGARPLQRVELEVAGQHVGIERRELMAADVDADADLSKILLDD